jgi:hypothetical protein
MPPMTMLGRALPYLLSWGILAVLMLIGMNRVPLALYTPIDGEWAKWNVEAILHFGKIFDLSPYTCWPGWARCILPTCPGSIRERWPSRYRSTKTPKSIASYAIMPPSWRSALYCWARASSDFPG